MKKDSVLFLKENRYVNDSGQGLLLERNKLKNLNSSDPSRNKGSFFRFSDDYLIELENYFSNEKLCKICYHTVLNQVNSFTFDQGHIFCFNCIKIYVKLQIHEGKEKIKCPKLDCKVYKSDVHFFKLFLNKSEMCVLEKNLKRHELFTFKSDLDLVECPHPDCEEFIKIKYKMDKKYEQCSKGHKFCTVCKKECGNPTNCKIVRNLK
jgi:hypothetical protein